MDNKIVLYILAGFLAFIPAIIWISFIFKKAERKWLQALLFFGSIFSVVPIFLLHYFLDIFPQFNILEFLQSQIENQNTNYILLFISVGIVEEIVKQLLIRYVDKKYLLIQTVNDSIRYSLIGALGFAFAENIFYIVSIFSQLGLAQLIVPYLFRSIFTTAAHLIFSGFFGYFYGIAKFSLNVVEQSRWIGRKHIFSNAISRILNISRIQAHKELTILRGLTVAIVLHAIFNFLLQLNQILIVTIYVVIGFMILLRTLKLKSGKLIMITDISEERSSSMAKTDQDVVVELLGMWFKDKKFVDVMHVCQRLLERDPDNKVVQLFKAQALDKISDKSAYGNILQKMLPSKGEHRSSLTDMIRNKTVIKKDPNQIKKLSKLKLPDAKTPVQNTPPQKPKNDTSTFDLDI